MSNTGKHANKHLLAALDLSVMDKYILSFLRQNAEALGSTNVQFMHVAKNPSKEEELQQKLKDHIHEYYPEASGNHELLVVTGDPEKEIKNWSSDQQVDMLVLGEKASADREVALKKLVKNSTTSLLIVPKKEKYSINKIGVAVDFSELSALAVKEADALAQQFQAKLLGFHAYQVPSGYHKSGKDHHEFAKVMEKNAREDAAAFWEKLGLKKPEIQYVYDENKEPDKCISNFAEENEIDLLILGSQGRTDAAAVVIGSIAKSVMQRLSTVPLMVFKEKNKKMDVMDAIKEL